MTMMDLCGEQKATTKFLGVSLCIQFNVEDNHCWKRACMCLEKQEKTNAVLLWLIQVLFFICP